MVHRTPELGLEAWIRFGHVDHSGSPLQGKEAVNGAGSAGSGEKLLCWRKGHDSRR